MRNYKKIARVDLQVTILTFLVVLVSCFTVFIFDYFLTHKLIINDLKVRTEGIHSYLEARLDRESIIRLNTEEDMESSLYRLTKDMLDEVRAVTGVRYLYTAKETEEGEYIYLVDGLPADSVDFRNVGQPLEEEIIPDIQRALKGETVEPTRLKNTSWGHIYISYFPIYSGDKVIGVIGIEFDAAFQNKISQQLMLITPCVIIIFSLLSCLIAVRQFRRISNPNYRDFANTDILTGLANRNAFDVAINNLESGDKKNQVGIIGIDFDGLKKINDTFGHTAGDQFIKNGSSLIKRFVRKPDQLYRIGGDEFVILLLGKEVGQMKELMDKIEKNTRDYNLSSEQKISFSMGCALFDHSRDKSLEDTFQRADTAMYQMKQEKKKLKENHNESK